MIIKNYKARSYINWLIKFSFLLSVIIVVVLSLRVIRVICSGMQNLVDTPFFVMICVKFRWLQLHLFIFFNCAMDNIYFALQKKKTKPKRKCSEFT